MKNLAKPKKESHLLQRLLIILKTSEKLYQLIEAIKQHSQKRLVKLNTALINVVQSSSKSLKLRWKWFEKWIGSKRFNSFNVLKFDTLFYDYIFRLQKRWLYQPPTLKANEEMIKELIDALRSPKCCEKTKKYIGDIG